MGASHEKPLGHFRQHCWPAGHQRSGSRAGHRVGFSVRAKIAAFTMAEMLGGGTGGFHYDESLGMVGAPIGFRIARYIEDVRE